MSQILLEIQTNNDPNVKELRFSALTTIGDLKNRLEMITGASAGTMELFFRDTQGTLIGEATNDVEKTILDFHPAGSELHLQLQVKDTNLKFDEDLSAVEKFEISEDEYNNRKNTVRNYKLQNRIGRFSEEALKKETEEEEMMKLFKIGSRCEVKLENVAPRRGTVMYKGKLGSKPGYFVGVKYDEPCGKNNGSFEGEQYFDCAPNYGGFVKPMSVVCGDFPEEEINFDD